MSKRYITSRAGEEDEQQGGNEATHPGSVIVPFHVFLRIIVIFFNQVCIVLDSVNCELILAEMPLFQRLKKIFKIQFIRLSVGEGESNIIFYCNFEEPIWKVGPSNIHRWFNL